MTDSTSPIPAKGSLRRALSALLGQQKLALSLAVGFACLAALLELVPYGLLFLAINTLWQGAGDAELADKLLVLSGALALALLLKYVFYALAYFFSHRSAYRILQAQRQKLVTYLARLPLLHTQQYGSGDVKRIVLQDVEQLESFIAHHTVEVTAAVIAPLAVAGYLFWVDWRLACMALATVPLAILVSAIPLSRLQGEFDRYNRSANTLHASVVEYLRNMPVMKAFGLNLRSFQHLRQQVDDYYRLVHQVTHRTVPGWSLFMVLLTANSFLLLPLGVWLYGQGNIAAPELLLALMLGTGMLNPLFKLSHISSEGQQLLSSLSRIQGLLDVPCPAPAHLPELTPPFTLRAHQVNFYYAQDAVLVNIDLHLVGGSFTALVGPSGAGKSTLALLLSGLAQPQSGAITLNGVAISQLSDKQRSHTIAVATQEVFLFKGSLRDNLLLARPDASDEEIQQALAVAQLDALAHSLPQGLDTPLGERGLQLSGGERQRLALARALLRAAPILILDEATAFADAITEQKFYRALRTHYPTTTLLVIAHRLPAIEHADHILVMADGRIQAEGCHQELMHSSALYQNLWQRHKAADQWLLRPTAPASMPNAKQTTPAIS